MSAKYSVIQYVPNPNSGERINIGIVVWDDHTVRVRFSDNWSRARTFGGEPVDYLRDFAHGIAQMAEGQGDLIARDNVITGATLEGWAKNWTHSIQFTEPSGSLESPDAVLESASKIFLREATVRRRSRTRAMVAHNAYRTLLNAVMTRVKEPELADHLVHQRESLDGSTEKHTFDVVLRNGKALAAVHAISFEISPTELRRDIGAMAWTLEDVRKNHRKLALAVAAAPPKDDGERQEAFQRAQKICRALDANVLASDTAVSRWAAKTAATVPVAA